MTSQGAAVTSEEAALSETPAAGVVTQVRPSLSSRAYKNRGTEEDQNGRMQEAGRAEKTREKIRSGNVVETANPTASQA